MNEGFGNQERHGSGPDTCWGFEEQREFRSLEGLGQSVAGD